MFGSNETTTGGRALKFYSSVRMEIRREMSIKDGDQTIGNRTKVKVVKTNLASPFKLAEFDIIYGEGISREGDLLDLGTMHAVIEKSGAWFSYKETRLGQGRENVKKFLKEILNLAKEIEEQLRVKLNLTKEEKKAAATA